MYDRMSKTMLRDASVSMSGSRHKHRWTSNGKAEDRRAVSAAQVVDYSFVQRARKELGLGLSAARNVTRPYPYFSLTAREVVKKSLLGFSSL